MRSGNQIDGKLADATLFDLKDIGFLDQFIFFAISFIPIVSFDNKNKLYKIKVTAMLMWSCLKLQKIDVLTK